jgi:tetratricopeptide (TPR) repeat protein
MRGALLAWAALAGVLPLGGADAATNGAQPEAPNSAVQCESAEGLAAAGALTEARALYAKQLESHPGLACAVAGIRATDKALQASKTSASEEEARMLCARAKADLAAHRDDDAVTAFKAALEKDPTEESCGAQGLLAESPHWLSRTAKNVENAFPSVLLWLGLVLLTVLLVLMTGHLKWIGPKFRGAWGIRSILRGRLSFADCDDSALALDMKVGKAFNAAMRERLQRFRTEALDPDQDAYGLDFGTGDEALAELVSGGGQLGSAVSKLGDASEHTKLIAALIGVLIAILPIKRLSVSAVAGPTHEDSQAGASKFFPVAKLFLERDSKLVAAFPLQGRALKATPKAGDYLGLSDAAAVWVQYEVARELSDSKLPLPDAESYALVREGLTYHDAGDDAQAEDAFEAALQRDRRNWAAHVNLAMTKARASQDYREAIEILRLALSEMQR